MIRSLRSSLSSALVLTIAHAFSVPAQACITPPASVNRPHASIIDESKSIILFKVGSNVRDARCKITVLKVLKGPDSAGLREVHCDLIAHDEWQTNFANHRDPYFWKEGGRLGLDFDCSVLSPTFYPGRTYVALFGIRPDTKQFEEVGGSGDKWLHFIEQHISHSHD